MDVEGNSNVKQTETRNKSIHCHSKQIQEHCSEGPSSVGFDRDEVPSKGVSESEKAAAVSDVGGLTNNYSTGGQRMDTDAGGGGGGVAYEESSHDSSPVKCPRAEAYDVLGHSMPSLPKRAAVSREVSSSGIFHKHLLYCCHD